MDKAVEIELNCGGEPCHPFEQEEDGLGVTILKRMVKKLDCRRENGLNRISIER